MKHAAFFAGLLLVSYGSWLIYRPAGFIVAGLIAIFVSLLLDKLAR